MGIRMGGETMGLVDFAMDVILPYSRYICQTLHMGNGSFAADWHRFIPYVFAFKLLSILTKFG